MKRSRFNKEQIVSIFRSLYFGKNLHFVNYKQFFWISKSGARTMYRYEWIFHVIDDLEHFAEREGLENLREWFEHARRAIVLDGKILEKAELTLSTEAEHRGLSDLATRNS